MKHVSATQVKMFDRCNRKWWWAYVQKLRTPPSPAMALGTKVHKEIEDYLEGKGSPPEDSIAKSAIPLLDEALSKFEEDILIEQPIEIPVEDTGILFVGRADIVDLGGDIPKVIDIKTTSNIVKWGAKPHKLSQDVQMNVYAYAVISSYAPSADMLEVSHLYVQTRGPEKAKFVAVRLSKSHIEDMWEGVMDSVHRMVEVSTEEFQNFIPANVHACQDFGGCPYMNHCLAAKRKRRF